MVGSYCRDGGGGGGGLGKKSGQIIDYEQHDRVQDELVAFRTNARPFKPLCIYCMYGVHTVGVW